MIRDKMFFVQRLSLMMRGGIPLSESLETLKKEMRSRVFKRALEDVEARVISGERFSHALGRHPKMFDPIFLHTIEIGEEGGVLQENLRYLASLLQSQYEMAKKIQGALIYPFLVVLLSLVVGVAVTFFVLPKVVVLFETLDLELPFATRALITLVSFVQYSWVWLFGAMVLSPLVLRALLLWSPWKNFFDWVLLRLPFLGELFHHMFLARFSRTFSTLLKSGVPLLEILEISARTVGNEEYRKVLLLVKSGVEQGEKISSGLTKQKKFFPAVFSEMVVVGEASGSLEESFQYLAEFHEKEVEAFLKNISQIVEPLLLILVGLFVAFLAVSIITPIYEFTGQLRLR